MVGATVGRDVTGEAQAGDRTHLPAGFLQRLAANRLERGFTRFDVARRLIEYAHAVDDFGHHEVFASAVDDGGDGEVDLCGHGALVGSYGRGCVAC